MTNVLLFLVFAGIIVTLYLLLKKKDDNGGDQKLAAMMERLVMINEQNENLRRMVDHKLSETHQTTQFHFQNANEMIHKITGQTAKVITEFTEKMTKLDDTNKQVISFTSQLQNLQDILKNPKQRGVLGEYFLEETLKNVLPPNSYQMQYGFKDGVVVDAVVFVKNKIIPVDSKFSLENYERLITCADAGTREELEKCFKQDLKNRIDETSKYIKPEEGTMEFAFMFIPSEAIYYDLLINKVGAVKVDTRNLIEYAFRDKKVVIVSPTSFLAYLQTVLQGLRAMEIEENAKEIKANVENLQKHILKVDEFMKKLGTNMSTTVNAYNSVYKELNKVDKDIVKISGGEKTVDPLTIDKPSLEEY